MLRKPPGDPGAQSQTKARTPPAVPCDLPPQHSAQRLDPSAPPLRAACPQRLGPVGWGADDEPGRGFVKLAGKDWRMLDYRDRLALDTDITGALCKKSVR